MTPYPQVCNTMGSMGISITGGTPNYQVNYTGPSTGSVVVAGTGNGAATIIIPDLPAGHYDVELLDANGCSIIDVIIIEDDGSNLSSEILAQPKICESDAGVYVTISGGKPGYAISYSGPSSGSCLLYTSPSPRDLSTSRMPSSA